MHKNNNKFFLRNQLAFRKKPNYLSIETELPPALKNKTFTELVQEKVNTLNSAR